MNESQNSDANSDHEELAPLGERYSSLTMKMMIMMS